MIWAAFKPIQPHRNVTNERDFHLTLRSQSLFPTILISLCAMEIVFTSRI